MIVSTTLVPKPMGPNENVRYNVNYYVPMGPNANIRYKVNYYIPMGPNANVRYLLNTMCTCIYVLNNIPIDDLNLFTLTKE